MSEVKIHTQLTLPCMPADCGLTVPQTGAEVQGKSIWTQRHLVCGRVGSRDGDSALSQGGLNSPGSKVASLSFMALPQAFLSTTGKQEGPEDVPLTSPASSHGPCSPPYSMN